MQAVSLQSITKTFGATAAIGGVTLDVHDREFMAVVGPSGCGKSTLLQIAAGLLPATSGQANVHGRLVTAPPPEVVYLFQQYTRSLLPWRRVIDNVAFAIEHRGFPRAEVNARAMTNLARVGLEKFARHYPWQLSGGMQQRVAIARALTAEPKVLMLDEPFSSVDALTRLDLQALIQDIWLASPMTVVMVTHDVDEAIYLADRVAVLTHRPSRVGEVIEVALDRPRRPIETRELRRFLDLRHHLLDLLLRRPDA